MLVLVLVLVLVRGRGGRGRGRGEANERAGAVPVCAAGVRPRRLRTGGLGSCSQLLSGIGWTARGPCSYRPGLFSRQSFGIDGEVGLP